MCVASAQSRLICSKQTGSSRSPRFIVRADLVGSFWLGKLDFAEFAWVHQRRLDNALRVLLKRRNCNNMTHYRIKTADSTKKKAVILLRFKNHSATCFQPASS